MRFDRDRGLCHSNHPTIADKERRAGKIKAAS
jgi:hypothetical protein